MVCLSEDCRQPPRHGTVCGSDLVFCILCQELHGTYAQSKLASVACQAANLNAEHRELVSRHLQRQKA